jgi:uncharacterized protein (TIGR03435 family)
MQRLSLFRTLSLLLPALAFAQIQSTQPPPARPEFEVASVKPNTGGGRGMRLMRQPGGRMVAENVPTRTLITFAYDMQDYQILGGPPWIASDTFDITAKAAGEVPPEQMRLMMQSLLADRFRLAVHRETKEGPVYNLTPSKGGLKLTDSAGNCVVMDRTNPPPPPPPGTPLPKYCGMVNISRSEINIYGSPMAQLVQILGTILGRAVVDKTGATGSYNFHLEFTPDQATTGGPFGQPGPGAPINAPPPDSASPNIFTALQEQLGIKADSARGQVEMLVIDHLERPSEN